MVPYEKRLENTCPMCGEKGEYQFPAPNVVGKESFLDGHKRKGWAEIREKSKLQQEARKSRSREKRSEIASEIRKLSVVKDK